MTQMAEKVFQPSCLDTVINDDKIDINDNDDDDGDGDDDERRRMMAMLLVIMMTWQVTTMCSVKSALLGSLNFFSMSLHR